MRVFGFLLFPHLVSAQLERFEAQRKHLFLHQRGWPKLSRKLEAAVPDEQTADVGGAGTVPMRGRFGPHTR